MKKAKARAKRRPSASGSDSSADSDDEKAASNQSGSNSGDDGVSSKVIPKRAGFLHMLSSLIHVLELQTLNAMMKQLRHPIGPMPLKSKLHFASKFAGAPCQTVPDVQSGMSAMHSPRSCNRRGSLRMQYTIHADRSIAMQ